MPQLKNAIKYTLEFPLLFLYVIVFIVSVCMALIFMPNTDELKQDILKLWSLYK
jgi:competence protein ComGC